MATDLAAQLARLLDPEGGVPDSPTRAIRRSPDAGQHYGESRTGRSGSGNLRNFKQMSDAKFNATLAAVEQENDDPEALDALRAELLRRGAVA